MFRCDGLQRLLIVPANVTEPGGLQAYLTIDSRVGWLPCRKAVDVTVAHAEDGGDEDGVVNLAIGGSLIAGLGDVFFGDMLAAELDFAGDVEQGLHLGRDVGVEPVGLDSLDELLVVIELGGGERAVQVGDRVYGAPVPASPPSAEEARPAARGMAKSPQ